MTLRPAPPDTGIRFVRTDLEGHPMVKASFEHVRDTNLATSIGLDGYRISTIEHLMAAFFGLGIDNAVVTLDGPEVPIMDGSSAPFVFLVKNAGIREQKSPKRFLVMKKSFGVEDGDRSILIHPSKKLKITYQIDFDHPLMRNQAYEFNFSGRHFVRDISRARTFGFLSDVQRLRRNGFARGGSLDNAIVIDDFKILNEEGLRFTDEFVRHKTLDFIGDLSIIGCPVIGHFIVKKSGHFLNHQALKSLIASEEYWKTLSFESPEECYKEEGVTIPAFGRLDPLTP